MQRTANENWTSCPQCGQPLLISSDTGVPEPCAQCASQRSPWPLAWGIAFLVGLVAVVVAIVYLFKELLLG